MRYRIPFHSSEELHGSLFELESAGFNVNRLLTELTRRLVSRYFHDVYEQCFFNSQLYTTDDFYLYINYIEGDYEEILEWLFANLIPALYRSSALFIYFTSQPTYKVVDFDEDYLDIEI